MFRFEVLATDPQTRARAVGGAVPGFSK